MKKYKGYSLIEVMTAIAIIGIISAVSLVSISGSRTKARDNAVFSQMQSAQAMVYRCLKSGMTNSAGSPTAYLIAPYANANPGTSLCGYDTGTANAAVAGFPDWPNLGNAGGWAYAHTNYEFMWCRTNSTLLSRPTSLYNNYVNGTWGGSRATGDFCYIMKNGSKYIWCTKDGCAKQNF